MTGGQVVIVYIHIKGHLFPMKSVNCHENHLKLVETN